MRFREGMAAALALGVIGEALSGAIESSVKGRSARRKLERELEERARREREMEPGESLMLAVAQDDCARARRAIRAKAYPFEGPDIRSSAVWRAIEWKRDRCLAAMLEECDKQPTPWVKERASRLGALQFAIEQGSGECALVLISWGVDVNAPDESGRLSLALAVEAGDLEVARELMRAGARADGLWPQTKKIWGHPELSWEEKERLFEWLVEAGSPSSAWEAWERRVAGAVSKFKPAAGWAAVKSRLGVGAGERRKGERRAGARGLEVERAKRLLIEADLSERARESGLSALRLAAELSPGGSLPAEGQDAFDLKRLWEVNLPQVLEALAGIPAEERGWAEAEGKLAPRASAEAAIETAVELMTGMRRRALQRARLRLEAEIAVMDAKGGRSEERGGEEAQ